MQTYNSPYFFRRMSKTVVDRLLAHPQQRLILGNLFAMFPDHIKNTRLQLFVLLQSPVVFLITY